MFRSSSIKILVISIVFLLLVFLLKPDEMGIILVALLLSIIFGIFVSDKSFFRKMGWIFLNSLVMIIILVIITSFLFISDPNLQNYKSCLADKSTSGFCRPPGIGQPVTFAVFSEGLIAPSIILLVFACIGGVVGLGIRYLAFITGKKVKI